MLGKAFGTREFSEDQLLKDKKREFRLYGEFRWDKEQQNLVITQHLFHDDIIREKLLLHAQEVLQHSLLTPGFREGLQGGYLSFTPPFEPQVTWTVDVDAIEYEWPICKKFIRSTAFIGRKLVEEFAKPVN